ncbi:MAG TPA: heavy metal translocating P-type ATPase [Gemmatimonadaceae bacterium]|nr:heavy metal translocating P-type ATPase [Gemmatimonadaceae bacterium]
MRVRLLSLGSTLLFLAAGGVCAILGRPNLARDVWMLGVVATGAPIVFRTLRAVAHGRLATDIVASLSIIGATALDQPLAGLVIVLMQAGGEALERYAEGRASAAVRALEAAAPRKARRVREGAVDEVPAADVRIGDTLLILPGDLVPCDGVVVDGESELDTSSLTGESAPLRATRTTRVMSGMANGFGSFRMIAMAPAERSQYARIVELVRSAQTSKAPLQRLADRYAVWFTPITVAVCGIAVGLTHDWMRALSILVVATPCPLILATPVAIIGGINRAAHRFVIIRHGGALEALSEVNTAVFDKTGTLTVGTPMLERVAVDTGFDRATVLGYAAAVERRSSHLLARVLVDAVQSERIRVPESTGALETPGQGVAGVVDGHYVRVGARSFIVPDCVGGVLAAARLERPGATLRAYVSIDQRLAAVFEYADQLRPDLAGLLGALESSGIRRMALLSGDHAPIARDIAARVGIEETYGDLMPGDKAQFIERMRAEGGVVMMIGDGINDAPALSTADVGVALASHGGGIAAEAADVIILVDSLSRVSETKVIADRTMRIARQSIRVGLGLSGVAMLVAAFGGLAPIVGAALQEVIDVAVILNALRTSVPPRSERRRADTDEKPVATEPHPVAPRRAA